MGRKIALALTAILAAAILITSGVLYFKDHAHAKPDNQASPSASPVAQQGNGISEKNVQFLEQHINSAKLDDERQALDPDIRDGMTTPMFPNGGDLKIDIKSFQIDPDSKGNAATIGATATGYHNLVLVLAHEGDTWYLTDTEEGQ